MMLPQELFWAGVRVRMWRNGLKAAEEQALLAQHAVNQAKIELAEAEAEYRARAEAMLDDPMLAPKADA